TCAPETIGLDDHGIVQLHDFLHTAQMSDGLFVHGHKLAAKHRRYSDGAVPHVWQLGVDAVTQAAIDLGRNIEAADGLADELEFALGLQFGMRRGAVSRSVRGEFAITEALS